MLPKSVLKEQQSQAHEDDCGAAWGGMICVSQMVWKEEGEAEFIFEKISTESFPKVKDDKDLQIQEA